MPQPPHARSIPKPEPDCLCLPGYSFLSGVSVQCHSVTLSKQGWGICLFGPGAQTKVVAEISAAARAVLSLRCLPCLRASQCRLAPQEWCPGFSLPSGPPTSQGGLPPLCKVPGLECPICGSHCSLLREDLCPYILLFPLSPSPGALVQN